MFIIFRPYVLHNSTDAEVFLDSAAISDENVLKTQCSFHRFFAGDQKFVEEAVGKGEDGVVCMQKQKDRIDFAGAQIVGDGDQDCAGHDARQDGTADCDAIEGKRGTLVMATTIHDLQTPRWKLSRICCAKKSD